MFGVDNTGVINQRQSPAIWQSDIADFPPNYILGRILIDTFQGGIYIDTASTRLQISNGSKNFVNGVTSFGGIPTSQNIGLGGDMLYDTEINMNGGSLLFNGSNNSLTIDSQGNLSNQTEGSYYLPVMVIGLTSIIPTNVLLFTNPFDGHKYAVSATQI